jgi:hypothetical protein
MEQQKNINVSVNEGDSFYCHELSINYSPLQFTFDFKCITPRVDVRSKESPSINIKHNVVMLDPWHAKKMLELLTKVVSDFEKDFGKIDKPKALKKVESKSKKASKGQKKTGTAKKTISAPTYFG